MQSEGSARFAVAMLAVRVNCRMHGQDLSAYLAGICTAIMAGVAFPQLPLRSRLIPGCPGRGMNSHLVRVPN
jgi:hypothetical protein